MNPHPAYDRGAYRKARAICLLYPQREMMIGNVFASAFLSCCSLKWHCGSMYLRAAIYTARYARVAPDLEKVPVAMRLLFLFAVADNAFNCVTLLRSTGDFQCPSVLCGSSGVLGLIMIDCFVLGSIILIESLSRCRIGTGVPSGLNSKERTWYEHLVNSSVPPEHQSKSFHNCASDSLRVVRTLMGASVCGWKSL